MPKYRVTMNTQAWAYVTVEAGDEDEAIDLAFNEPPDICAQCSGWNEDYTLELGEWDAAEDVPVEVVTEDDR